MLRDYQERGLGMIRAAFAENRRVIMCAPTGAGKTVMFSAMAEQAAMRGTKTIILTDRKELFAQSVRAMQRAGLAPAELKAGTVPDFAATAAVAMVETLNRRIENDAYLIWLQSFNFIVIDEAHKACFDKLFDCFAADSHILGATATPVREKNQRCLATLYGSLTQVCTVSELVHAGHLCRPRYFRAQTPGLGSAPMKGSDYDNDFVARVYSENHTYRGVVRWHLQQAQGRKTLLFAPNIAASKEAVAEFVLSGYDARHLDSYASDAEREDTLTWYARTPGAILSNVGILTTGFDSPETEVVILYRKTKSISLYLQMTGRGSRPHPGKSEFMVVDFGDNFKEHGFWDAERTWFLNQPPRRSPGTAPRKTCNNCLAINLASARECYHCGQPFPVRPKKEIEAEVVEVEAMSAVEAARQEWWEMPSKDAMKYAKKFIHYNLDIVADMAKAGRIKSRWVIHQLNLDQARVFCQKLGYKPGWLYANRSFFPHLNI